MRIGRFGNLFFRFYNKSWFYRVMLTSTIALGICLGGGIIILTRRIEVIFGKVHLDQILFHFMMPREAVPSDVVVKMCQMGWSIRALITACCCLAIFSLSLTFKQTFLFLSSKLHVSIKNILVILSVTSSILLLVGISLFCWKFSVLQSIIFMFQESTIIEDNYTAVSLDEFKQTNQDGVLLKTENKPNLVLIISESLDNSFADPAIFGKNLIEELCKLKSRGDYTDNLFQANGCHYTIASMYSISYGMPLLYLHLSNGEPVKQNVFSKRCISIFDILNSAGYNVCHLQGTPLKFAGQGTIFTCIENAKCIGADEISMKEYPNRQSWGLWDSDLFEKAKKEILELAKDNKPFSFSMQTIDPHGENTLQPGQEAQFGDYRDIIRLQSRLISNFVDWIQNEPFGKNTVIVILGDHCLMSSKYNFPEINYRRVFNLILNSKAKGNIKNRSAAEFDFAPTILEALSFKWSSHSLGIGHSLYYNKPTVVEANGFDGWNAESNKHSKLYAILLGVE